jgi:hypothetical protein
MTFSNVIVEQYSNIVNEYFEHICSSEIIKNISNSDVIIKTGLDTITHIFKINLVTRKSIEIASFYSQKAYYCYLEYIEQIHKNNMTQDLNTIDALLFLYNKTLSKEDDVSILNVNAGIIQDNDIKIIDHILCNISTITNFLLNWDNNMLSMENRVVICKDMLLKYLHLFYNIGLTNLIEYFLILNEKIKMSYSDYYAFLDELYKKMKKMKKIPTSHEMREHFLYNIYNEDDIINIYKNNNIKQFVKLVFP